MSKQRNMKNSSGQNNKVDHDAFFNEHETRTYAAVTKGNLFTLHEMRNMYHKIFN